MPDLRQLQTFLAVAEELSFTRAAERLHVGQQAVSKTIATLERELGVTLLERTTREVHLTAAGRALCEAGPEVLTAAEAAFTQARTAGHGLSGTVRVGTTPAISPTERTEVARVLRTGAEELSVSLREVRPAEIRRLLRNRSLDLVLARTSDTLEGIEATALRPTPAVLCVPDDHPLAHARSVRVAQLDGARLMTWSPPGTPYTDLLVTRLAAAGATVEPVQAPITGTAGTALTELTDSNAVAVVPTGWPPSEGITQVLLADDVTLPLLLLWPAGPLSPAVTRVLAAMRLNKLADGLRPIRGE